MAVALPRPWLAVTLTLLSENPLVTVVAAVAATETLLQLLMMA